MFCQRLHAICTKVIRMLTIHDMRECSIVNDLIQNRVNVINTVLGYGYKSYDPAAVRYPRGTGRGVLSICGVDMLDWRLHDLESCERALYALQLLDDSLYHMSLSGHMFWF